MKKFRGLSVAVVIVIISLLGIWEKHVSAVPQRIAGKAGPIPTATITAIQHELQQQSQNGNLSSTQSDSQALNPCANSDNTAPLYGPDNYDSQDSSSDNQGDAISNDNSCGGSSNTSNGTQDDGTQGDDGSSDNQP